MSSYYQTYCDSLREVLRTVVISDLERSNLGTDKGLERLCALTMLTKTEGRRMLFCGNGASAVFASHMALDWTKNGGVVAQAFNDSALLTALVNDLGPERLFADPVGWYGSKGDLLVTISSSGNSSNIVAAIVKAREVGMSVVTLTGLKPDNRSRAMGDLNLYLPAKTYGVVECGHQVLLHIWLDLFMGITEWERDSYQDMRAENFTL